MELPSLIYSRFYQGTACMTAEAEAPERIPCLDKQDLDIIT